MVKKQERKWNKKLITIAFAFGVSLSGCGESAETVTDYGNMSSEKTSAESLTEEVSSQEIKNTSESIDIQDARSGQKLSDWLGGKELSRENTFSIGKYPANSSLFFWIAENEEEIESFLESGKGASATLDTDELPAWRVSSVTQEGIHESEIVHNLLGDNATEIRGTVSLSAGDAELVVGACRDFIGRYDNSFKDDDAFYQEFDNPDHSWQAWFEGENYYWHTYEGKYMDMDYQLVIGYLGEYHQKVISFFPKNAGDLVGAPECNLAKDQVSGQVQVDTGEDKWEWKTLEELGAKKKEVSKNRETLQKEAESFVKNKLFAKVNDIQVNDTNLLFYNESFNGQDYSNTIIGGVCASISWSFGKQTVYTDEGTIANTGQIWMTDDGVVGIRAYIGWNFEECLSEQVAIMPFDTAMESLEAQIAKNLDLTKVTASALTLFNLRFGYYPVASPQNPLEYTFIPVWIVGINSGNGTTAGYYMGEAIVNAIDGSLIDIKYSK